MGVDSVCVCVCGLCLIHFQELVLNQPVSRVTGRLVLHQPVTSNQRCWEAGDTPTRATGRLVLHQPVTRATGRPVLHHPVTRATGRPVSYHPEVLEAGIQRGRSMLTQGMLFSDDERA